MCAALFTGSIALSYWTTKHNLMPLATWIEMANTAYGPLISIIPDREVIEAYYRSYDRLMRHWASVLDVEILEFEYEALVFDQMKESRRLVKFLGLEWDEACLDFQKSKRVTLTRSNAQVRKAMYTTSVGRRDNYLKHLEPLIDALGDVVVGTQSPSTPSLGSVRASSDPADQGRHEQIGLPDDQDEGAA